MSVSASVRRQMLAKGRVFSLRSGTSAPGANAWTQGAAAYTYATALGREFAAKPGEVRGGIQDTAVSLVLEAAGLAGVVPKSGDYIAAGILSPELDADVAKWSPFAPGGLAVETVTAGNVKWREVLAVVPMMDGGETVTFQLTVRK